MASTVHDVGKASSTAVMVASVMPRVSRVGMFWIATCTIIQPVNMAAKNSPHWMPAISTPMRERIAAPSRP
jgi:hypothetical protein